VLLRAQLVGGCRRVIGALTGLVEGQLPVAAPRSTRTGGDEARQAAGQALERGDHDRLEPRLERQRNVFAKRGCR